jgi:hypothetical protein
MRVIIRSNMLEIKTTQSTSQKELTIKDSVTGKRYSYTVRQPGAGESLKMSQYSKVIKRLEKITEKTEAETDEGEEVAMNLLKILLGLYNPNGNAEAREYLDILSAEDLMGGIEAVFNQAGDSGKEA